MAKVFGINTKIRGKVGEYIYRQTKVGTIVSEAPVKPITPLRTQSQMNIRTQWANLGAIYKQFDSMPARDFLIKFRLSILLFFSSICCFISAIPSRTGAGWRYRAAN